jgi:hypothetical protein
MNDSRRGFIATADLPVGGTRVDLAQRDVVSALGIEHRRTGNRTVGWPIAGRQPVPEPAKTVYLTLLRPEGMRNQAWVQLASAVRATVFQCKVTEWATALDDVAPSIHWVLLVAASHVVALQDLVVGALGSQGPAAQAIWSEAIPRTLNARPRQ